MGNGEFTILEKDFNSNGHIAIFRINSKSLIEKYECDIMITPLKSIFITFKEKRGVNVDLHDLRRIYVNFVYFPYDFKLIQMLKDN
jgi:hypothetical protein